MQRLRGLKTPIRVPALSVVHGFVTATPRCGTQTWLPVHFCGLLMVSVTAGDDSDLSLLALTGSIIKFFLFKVLTQWNKHFTAIKVLK